MVTTRLWAEPASDKTARTEQEKLLAQFKGPLALLLIVATVISLIAWALEGFHGFPLKRL
jgi:hypothetical protein